MARSVEAIAAGGQAQPRALSKQWAMQANCRLSTAFSPPPPGHQVTIDFLLAALPEHGNALKIASEQSLARNRLATASAAKRAILRAH